MTGASEPDVLVRPTWESAPAYDDTLGGEVAELCELAGFAPDAQQRLALNYAFALKDRRRAAREVAVIAGRQNIKTGFFKQCALGWLFITEDPVITWSAHLFDTAQKAFGELTELIEDAPDLDRHVASISRSHGDEAIILKSGSTVEFKARTKTGGRGLTGSKMVMDEAFALQRVHMGALIPTLSTYRSAQVVYGSSAGFATSDVLRSIRNRGRAGGDPDLIYLEWGNEVGGCRAEDCSHVFGEVEGCAFDDLERLQAANPTMGHRIPVDHILWERRTLDPAEFARERMGWWDEPSASSSWLTPALWESLADARSAAAGRVVFGVASTLDMSRTVVVAAGLRADGRMHLEVVEDRPGQAWVADRVAELARKWSAPVVIDGNGPARAFVARLGNAGIDPHLANTKDAVDAFALFRNGVRGRSAAHRGQLELTMSALEAAPRKIGDGNVWARSGDFAPIEAATLAWWGVETLPDDSVSVWFFDDLDDDDDDQPPAEDQDDDDPDDEPPYGVVSLSDY